MKKLFFLAAMIIGGFTFSFAQSESTYTVTETGKANTYQVSVPNMNTQVVGYLNQMAKEYNGSIDGRVLITSMNVDAKKGIVTVSFKEGMLPKENIGWFFSSYISEKQSNNKNAASAPKTN